MLMIEEEKPEGAPEWIVSYADMITIVMSFFVVMFSIASGEAAKGKRSQQQQVAIDSLQYRFGPRWKPFTSWSLMPGNSLLPGGGKGLGSPAPIPAQGDPGGTVRVLKKEKARIRVNGEGDLYAIGNPIYFDNGSTNLVAGQSGLIQSIADELAGKSHQFQIVATASKRPLPPGCPFRDRWELGYARCRQMADLFTALKVEPERLKLSVLPDNVRENKEPHSSEADLAVKVYLSNTLPEGEK
jgi:chemotaxis protein MotB